MIVRIAGLPGTALSHLGSPSLLELSSRLEQLRRSLRETHSALADRIASQLSRFSVSERRFLLAVRRDCFNQRGLTKRVTAPEWALIESLAPDLVGLQAEVSEKLRAQELALEDLFNRELEREVEVLYAWATDPRLLRGLALGAPEVIQALRKRHEHPAQDRRRRKLDLTMLRFVTRAAAKLSPNSTFTLLALCRIKSDAKEILCTLEPDQIEERSFLHLDRSYLDQLQELLLLAPEIRSHCRVTVNDTIEEFEGEFFRWIKPCGWQFDRENGKLVFTPLSIVKATLAPEVLSRIRRLVVTGTNLYQELSCAVGLEPEDGNGPGLDRLIELGLLHLLPPWPVGADLSGERAILNFLRDRELENPALQEFRQELARLVALQMELPTSLHPDQCLSEMRQRVDSLRELAGRFLPATNEPPLSSICKDSRLFHESVFVLRAAPDSPDQAAVLAIAQDAFQDLQRITQALYRFTELFNYRHDLLHSLEHFWHFHFPQDTSLPAFEFFRRISPLWKQYLGFDRERRESSISTFNPYDLLQLQDLASKRELIYRAFQEHLIGNDYNISTGSLEALVEGIPERYRPQVGSSGMVQPLPRGSWVLNRLLEGTGRYSSRYISALPSELGRFLASASAAHTTAGKNDDAAELLDLACIRGGISEVHHSMTLWVLEMPGDCQDIPDAKKVRLSDLRMHFEVGEPTIVLRRSTGQRLLPVHLTSLNHSFLPSILRFLSVFGPYEVRQVLPRAPRVERLPGCFVSERVTCDRLVVSRKRWELSHEAMSALRAEQLSAHDFFLEVQVWRERFGIPAEAYVYEKIHSPRENLYHYKPQFMNFSSPLMCQLFCKMRKKTSDRCIVDEALPGRDQFTTYENDLRAMELQFDCLWPTATPEPIPAL